VPEQWENIVASMSSAKVLATAFALLVTPIVRAQPGWTTISSPVYPDWISSTAYDPVQQLLWSFRFNGGPVDVHAFDGTAWTVVGQPSTPTISVLGTTRAVHDPVRDVFVHTVTAPGFQLQTWEWNRSTWTLRNTRPSPIAFASLMFHAGRGTVFGVARVGNGSQSSLQFFEWLPPNWVQRATLPGQVDSYDAAYDAVRNALVLVYRSGGLHHTRSWDMQSWLELVPPQLSESYLTLAWDPAHQRLIGFFDSHEMTTFELTATGWRRHQHDRVPQYGAGFGWGFTPMPHLDRIALVQNQPYLATRTGTYLYDHAEPLTASYVSFGPGCAGSQGVPVLAAEPGHAPRLGSIFVVQVDNVPATTPFVALTTGFDAQSWKGHALPRDLTFLGMPGCAGYYHPIFLGCWPPSGGSVSIALSLPANLDLLGQPFYHQAFVPDLNAGNPAGAVVSNAMFGVAGSQ